MKPLASLLTAAALCFAGNAFAACPDQSANSDPSKTAGIAKDGTHAPLETPKPADQTGKTPAKDGNTMPLAAQDDGGNKDLATSQQDVESQQQGEKTAAAKADAECKD